MIAAAVGIEGNNRRDASSVTTGTNEHAFLASIPSATDMFRSGAFVADHISPTSDEQVQPNGVDLTLDIVFEQLEPGRIDRDGKDIGERVARPLEELEKKDPDTYYLPKGAYVARYGERIEIPEATSALSTRARR